MKRLGNPNVPGSSNGWCCGSVLRSPEEMSETDIVLLSSLVPNAWLVKARDRWDFNVCCKILYNQISATNVYNFLDNS